MFYRASSFNGNISLWDVSQVRDMQGMFNGASSFNVDVSLWDISQVQDMSYMFYDASLFNNNLCAWADKTFPYTKATDIFTNSGCTYQSTPQIDQGGPFCASTCN
jgi:surface protein